MRTFLSCVALAGTAALLAACSNPDATAPDDTGADSAPDTLVGDLDDPDVALDTAPGGCEVASDCPSPLDLCVNRTCQAQIPCVSDKQCSDFGYVCDAQAGACVLCLTDDDCSGEQTCKAQTCVDPSGTCASSKECPSGQVCDKQAGVCVGCLQDSECDPLQHCVETVCKPDLCHANETACADGQTRKTCTANGSGWTSEACATGTLCLDGKCEKLLCSPRSKACGEDVNAVVTCNATGTSWVDPADCPEKSTCKEGACQPHVCTPSQQKCNAQGGIDVCAVDGLSEVSWFCPADGDGKPQTCVAGVKNASCKSQLCVPESEFCQNGKAMRCDAKGHSAILKADCALARPGGAPQLCLDGACAPASCTAGQTACADAATLAKCKISGLGYDDTPCGAGKACEDGACGAVVCAPGQPSCDGGKARKCSPAGTKNDLVDDCAAKGKACLLGACVAKVCTGGLVACQGAQVGTCKADGTGWALVACPEGQTCTGGKCTSKVCEPSAQGCNGAVVAACNGSGTAWVTVDDCPAGGKTCEGGVCVKVQSGYQLGGGFRSMTDTAGGGFRLVDQGWLTSDLCAFEYCLRGGFGP